MESVGPLCHHLPQRHHRGFPTPCRSPPCCSSCCPVHWLSVTHPCHFQKHKSRLQFSRYPGPQETQRIWLRTFTFHTLLGTFLGSTFMPCASVSQKHLGYHHFSPRLGPRSGRAQESFPKTQRSPRFSSPLWLPVWELFPVCLFHSFFLLIMYSLCSEFPEDPCFWNSKA